MEEGITSYVLDASPECLRITLYGFCLAKLIVSFGRQLNNRKILNIEEGVCAIYSILLQRKHVSCMWCVFVCLCAFLALMQSFE